MARFPLSYLRRRALSLALVWLGISVLAHGLASLAPGDPAEIVLLRETGEAPSAEAVRRLRQELRLDAPWPVRYARWLGGAVRGDLGRSYRTREPVLPALLARFPATLALATTALLIALVVALPLGVLSAMRRDSWWDGTTRVVALVGASVPSFWLGYLLTLLFAVTLRILPVAGGGDWAHLVLPALTLSIAAAAPMTRLTRAAVLDVLALDHVRTARAKGVPASGLITRHVLRNALNPIVTITAVRFGRLLGGAAIIETVFAWPGIGRHAVEAIFDRDYPTIQGFVLLTGTTFVILNLLVDLTYRWLDPRAHPFPGAGSVRVRP
ncbi:MAG: nickel ABC transporter permease [Gemmatimonadaceae bacterium]